MQHYYLCGTCAHTTQIAQGKPGNHPAVIHCPHCGKQTIHLARLLIDQPDGSQIEVRP